MVLKETEGGILYPDTPESVAKEKIESLGPADYVDNCGRGYVQRYPQGYCVVRALEFLKGEIWGDMALNFVHALRPSEIRVTGGGGTCDARPWRVTVAVDERMRIKYIEQEVNVGLYGGYQHGHALTCAMWGSRDKRKVSAEQVIKEIQQVIVDRSHPDEYHGIPVSSPEVMTAIAEVLERNYGVANTR